MTVTASSLQANLLYSYRIASADMRFIEVNTREIYLRHDPKKGAIIRGVIPGCGPTCDASLSKIFLEYAMSCKGFEGSKVVLESVVQFGERLGDQVFAKFIALHPDAPAEDIIPAIFDCILASMGGAFQKESDSESLKFTFSGSPFVVSAETSSLQHWISPAHKGFVAFFERLLQTADGVWTLLAPLSSDRDPTLQVIHLRKAALPSGG